MVSGDVAIVIGRIEGAECAGASDGEKSLRLVACYGRACIGTCTLCQHVNTYVSTLHICTFKYLIYQARSTPTPVLACYMFQMGDQMMP